MSKRLQTKDETGPLGFIGIGIVILWCVANFFGAMNGLMNGTSSYSRKECEGPWSRLEYVVPSYRFMCWMTEKPKETLR